MKRRGQITFVFDDGYEAIWKHVLPLLNNYNIPAVFALPLQSDTLAHQTKTTMRSWGEWQMNLSSIHEMAAHSVNHLDLTTLPQHELDDELRIPQETLKASTIVYPGGAVNNNVQATAAKYYKAGRTVRRGLETIPPKNPMALKTINFSRRNFTPLKANMLALYACATNKWLIETYHIIDTQPHDDIHSLPLDAFAKHLQFVARLPINKITIREALS